MHSKGMGVRKMRGEGIVSSQRSFSRTPSAHKPLQAYRSSQLALSLSEKITDYLCRIKIFKSTIMFPKDNFIILFLQSIKVFEVVREG